MDNQTAEVSITEAGGILSVLATFLMNIWNWISVKDINEFIVLITGIIGLVYMFFKARQSILDYRMKKKEYERDSE